MGVVYVLLLEFLLFKILYWLVNIIIMIVCFLGMSFFFLEGFDVSGGFGILLVVFLGVVYVGFMFG